MLFKNCQGIGIFIYIILLQISLEEKESVKEGLCDSTYGMSMSLLSEKDFFRVPFTDVLELVRSRKVFIHAGFAYIPSSEFVAVMSSVFRASLTQALMVFNWNPPPLSYGKICTLFNVFFFSQMTCRRLPNVDDERLAPLLKGLHTSYVGDDFKTPKGGEICIEDLDKVTFCLKFLLFIYC